MATEIKKIIVSITGTSGAIYGIRLLEILRRCGIETHLIISKSANLTIATETSFSINQHLQLHQIRILISNKSAPSGAQNQNPQIQ